MDQGQAEESAAAFVFVVPDGQRDGRGGRRLFRSGHEIVRRYAEIAARAAGWSVLYAQGVSVKRSIGSLKSVLGMKHQKAPNAAISKADLFFAGIIQLLCVPLANAPMTNLYSAESAVPPCPKQ